MAGKAGEMKKLYIEEISLVDKAANKKRFALTKSQAKKLIQKVGVVGAAVAGAMMLNDKWPEKVAANLPITEDELKQIGAGNSELLTPENVEAVATALDLPKDEMLTAAAVQVAKDPKVEGSTEADAVAMVDSAAALLSGNAPESESSSDDSGDPPPPKDDEGGSNAGGDDGNSDDVEKMDVQEIQGALESIASGIKTIQDELDADTTEGDNADKDGEEDSEEVEKLFSDSFEVCKAILNDKNQTDEAKQQAINVLQVISKYVNR